MSAVEALAEAWASIDGKLEGFRQCRGNAKHEAVRGYYGGYMADAAEMVDRLRKRGFDVLPSEDKENG